MGSGTNSTPDCPEPCRDVLSIITADDTTIVDAVLNGTLDHDDIDTFLTHVRTTDHALDPGLTHSIEIIDTLLSDRNI